MTEEEAEKVLALNFWTTDRAEWLLAKTVVLEATILRLEERLSQAERDIYDLERQND